MYDISIKSIIVLHFLHQFGMPCKVAENELIILHLHTFYHTVTYAINLDTEEPRQIYSRLFIMQRRGLYYKLYIPLYSRFWDAGEI
jgi:hypothetical protein